MNEINKIGALLAACKIEVGLEVAKDYCAKLCNAPELPADIRRVCEELHSALDSAADVVNSIAGRIDAEMGEPESQPEELA